MITTSKVQISDVKKRLSGQQNIYYLIDFIEFTDIKDENQNLIKREWCGMYYADSRAEIDILALKGQMVNLELNFYPNHKTVGERNFMDINAAIISLNRA